MIATCEYCKRSQEFGRTNGGCISCGAPLPKPEPVLVSRTYDIRMERMMIDVTTFGDDCRKFIPGIKRQSGTVTEVTSE